MTRQKVRTRVIQAAGTVFVLATLAVLAVPVLTKREPASMTLPVTNEIVDLLLKTSAATSVGIRKAEFEQTVAQLVYLDRKLESTKESGRVPPEISREMGLAMRMYGLAHEAWTLEDRLPVNRTPDEGLAMECMEFALATAEVLGEAKTKYLWQVREYRDEPAWKVSGLPWSQIMTTVVSGYLTQASAHGERAHELWSERAP